MYKKLILVLLLCGAGFGAQFTSTTSGNRNDGVTFGNAGSTPGVDYPDDGDTLTVAQSHNVTVPTGDTWAPGKITLALGAIGTYTKLTVAGSLNLTDSLVINRYGHLICDAGSVVNGGYVTKNPIVRISAYNYDFRINFNGTSDNHITLKNTKIGRVAIEQRDRFVATYTDFDSVSSVVIECPLDSIYVYNCTFKNYDTLTTRSGYDALCYKLKNSRFENPTWRLLNQLPRFSTTNIPLVDSCVFISDNGKELFLYNKYGIFSNNIVYTSMITIVDSLSMVKGNLFIVDTITTKINVPVKTVIENNYFVNNIDNPHFAQLQQNQKWANNIIDFIYPTYTDNGDIFFDKSFPDTAWICRNIIIEERSGPLLNALGSGSDTGRIFVTNNTYIGNITTQSAGLGETGGSLKYDEFWNNVFFNKNIISTGSVGFNLPQVVTDQLVYTDYNVWTRVATPYPVNLVMSDKDSGDVGYSASDLDVNPAFKDSSVSFKKFDIFLGGDGDDPVEILMKFANYSTGYTIENLRGFVRKGLIAKNELLMGTGRYGDDRNAVPFVLHHIDTILSNDTCYSVDSISSALCFSDSAGGYRDSINIITKSRSSGEWVFSDSTGLVKAGTRCTTFVKSVQSTDSVLTLFVGSPQLGGAYFTDTLPIITFQQESEPDTVWGHSDTVYVDQTLSGTTTTYSTANRDNTGTDGTGYADLQTALTATPKGTLILLRGGTYKQNGVRFELPAAANGTAWEPGEYNEIRSYPGEWAVLDGENNTTGGTWPAVLGSSSIRTYWKFENIEIKNGRSSDGTNARGFYADGGPFIFNRCYIHDNLCDISGNIPAGMSGHTWHDCLVEFCYFKNNGSNIETDHNAGHIIIFSDYREDSTIVHGFTDTGLYVARNTWRYNLIDSGATGMRVTKGGQLFCGRNPDAEHGYNDTYKTYGDQIYGNIIRNTLDDAIVVHQDFVQVHNNIIDNCYGGISMGTIERVRYKQCVYNNTIRNTYGKGIMAHHHKYPVEFNFEPMYYGYVYNNLLDSCTYGNTSDNTWDKEELALYVLNGWAEAKEDSFKISNCYSYRPAKRINDLTGTDIILQKTVRYTIAEYQAAINENSVLYLQDYDGGNTLYAGTTGADQYKTNGTHTVDGTNTIANGGSGGSHWYLDGVTLSSYVGATDPTGDDWVDTVLALEAYFDEQNPTWTTQAENDTITGDGQPVSFHAVHNLDEEINWFEVGVGLALEGSPLEFFASEADTARRFYAVAMWGEGLSDTTDTVKVVLRESSITITTQPASCTTLVGSTLSFFVAATTTGLPISYAMYRFGADTSIYYDSAITFVATAAHHGDSIRFVAYNLADTVWSNMAYISVVQIAIDTTLFGDGWYFKNKSGTNWPTSGWEISFVRGTAVGDTLSTTIAGQDGYGFSGIVPSAPLVVRTAPYYVLFTNGVYTIVRRQVFTPLGSSVVVTGKTSSSTSSSPY